MFVDDDGNIFCGIQPVALGVAQYTAVSYSWNQSVQDYDKLEVLPLLELLGVDETDGETSTFFGYNAKHFLHIPAPLKQMIRFLAAPAEDLTDASKASAKLYTFWIDQICINQEDTIEKTAQVRRMHDIYFYADQTYIYLGEPIEADEDGPHDSRTALSAGHALSFLATIDEHQVPGEWRDAGNDRTSLYVDWTKLPSIPGYQPLFSRGNELGIRPFRSFSDMFIRYKWFSRTWTLQEIICSRAPYVRIGTLELSWDRCVAACAFAKDTGMSSRLATSIVDRIVSLERMRRLRVEIPRLAGNAEQGEVDHETHRRIIENVALRSIPQVLPLVLFQAVTDPRDRVFAMLNVVSDMHNGITKPLCISMIDYELPEREVYMRLCEAWYAPTKHPASVLTLRIQGNSSRALSFIDFAVGSSLISGEDSKLPSWVPDWLHVPPGSVIIDAGPFQAGILNSEADACYVEFPSREMFKLEEVPLVVRGINLFSIYQKCLPAHDYREDYERSTILREEGTSYTRLLSRFSDPYPTTSISYPEAFGRLLDVTHEGGMIQRDQRTHSFWDFRSGVGDGFDVTRIRKQAITRDEAEQGLDWLSKLQLTGAFAGGLIESRALFATTNGFIGLGPMSLQEGDNILLLFGGRTPYIARRLPSGRFTLIGVCWVLGIMGGEALEGYPQDQVEDFVFI